MKGLKNKKDGKGDAKKDTKKEVILPPSRNRARASPKNNKRKKRKIPTRP